MTRLTHMRFYGVTTPFPRESATSWLQRVCQQYDMSLSTFLAFVDGEKRRIRDVDMALAPRHYPRLAELCGIQLECFDLMRRSLGRCSLRRGLRPLLAFGEKRRPAYGFCPLCWRDDKIPYLRIEWRFEHWRICLAHRTRMSSRCMACHSPLQIHCSILGGAGTVMPSLAHCFKCGFDLRHNIVPAAVDRSDNVASLVRAQIAIVSAVTHGYIHIAGYGDRRFEIDLLARWMKSGLPEVADAPGEGIADLELRAGTFVPPVTPFWELLAAEQVPTPLMNGAWPLVSHQKCS